MDGGIATITIHDSNRTDAEFLNKHLAQDDMRNASSKRGLGIHNIDRRLGLIFGERYGLHYESNESGLYAILTLPADSEPDGE